MKKTILALIPIILILGGCQKQMLNETNETTNQSVNSSQEGKKVALDDAVIQKENPNISTRVIENGTKVTLTVGDVVIPATLNDSKSSKQLISMLPYTVKLNRYSHDYCGVMDDPLDYDESDVHYGWLNGDIDFARDADYFTILFEDEEKSESFGHQINLGKVDGDLSQIKNLGDSVEMKIELAK